MRELIGRAYGWLKDQLRRIVMIMEEERSGDPGGSRQTCDAAAVPSERFML